MPWSLGLSTVICPLADTLPFSFAMSVCPDMMPSVLTKAGICRNFCNPAISTFFKSSEPLNGVVSRIVMRKWPTLSL